MAGLDIVEDRDPDFWRAVADHPAVQASGTMGGPGVIEALVADGRITPLRSTNGGYLFARLDPIGRVHELHALYRPEGWGRETHGALKAALKVMFLRGARVITVSEIGGNWRSRPPRSFGFRPAGDFAATHGFDIRTWTLTSDAWEASPAHRRSE